MGRFNTRERSVTTAEPTINKAGGEAFVETPELELVSMLLTSFVSDKFYGKAGEGLDRLVPLLEKMDPLFAAKASVYARDRFHMRSITHVVAGELGHLPAARGQTWTRPFYNAVVQRPDDITEVLAYYMNKYKGGIPNAMKDGLGRAFGKFDRYQLARYRGEGNKLKLVDAMNLLHPKPTGKNRDALRDLAADRLRSTETWEAKLTAAGQDAETTEDKVEQKKEAWESLIQSGKMGYFALLRNLHNIAEQAPEALDAALEQLVDTDSIKRSKVLPFRFETALEATKGLSRAVAVATAINSALERSLDNVPRLPGKTLVAVDNSGSMRGRPSEIASLFGAVLYRRNDADMMVFASHAQYLELDPEQTLSTMAHWITNAISKSTNVGPTVRPRYSPLT